jgi:hypothetical protein
VQDLVAHTTPKGVASLSLAEHGSFYNDRDANPPPDMVATAWTSTWRVLTLWMAEAAPESDLLGYRQ